jgi:hypothetical protein
MSAAIRDRRWTRESWRVSSAHDDLPPSQLPKGLTVEYPADGPGMLDGKIRPSSHMPRWACRMEQQAQPDSIALQMTERPTWFTQLQHEGQPALPDGYLDAHITGPDRELLAVFYTACNSEGGTADEIHLRGIRAALAQAASGFIVPTPPASPVPVSERLPEAEDCDDRGRCWLYGKIEGDWRLMDPAMPHLKYCFSHWAPHWAIPLPQTGKVQP